MDFLRTRSTNGGEADGQGVKHRGVARPAEPCSRDVNSPGLDLSTVELWSRTPHGGAIRSGNGSETVHDASERRRRELGMFCRWCMGFLC